MVAHEGQGFDPLIACKICLMRTYYICMMIVCFVVIIAGLYFMSTGHFMGYIPASFAAIIATLMFALYRKTL